MHCIGWYKSNICRVLRTSQHGIDRVRFQYRYNILICTRREK